MKLGIVVNSSDHLEEVRGMIRTLVDVSTKSRRHRGANFRARDLKELCAWERDLTENYGVAK